MSDIADRVDVRGTGAVLRVDTNAPVGTEVDPGRAGQIALGSNTDCCDDNGCLNRRTVVELDGARGDRHHRRVESQVDAVRAQVFGDRTGHLDVERAHDL